MALGGIKRVLRWVLLIALVIGIALALTRRAWIPTAARIALKSRGVNVENISWEGTNSWKFESVERRDEDGLTLRAKTITMLTPKFWRKALKDGDTNIVYVTVYGWRVILPQTNSVDTNSIAQKIRSLNDQLHAGQTNCPRAVLLNGTVQTARGDFNFGAVEWKGGELSGDFTWPQLNDPADFKLKIVDSTKLQLIAKQTALEIGARATAEILSHGAHLAGNARWKTNRVDFDVTYPNAENLPRHAVIDSKGLSIPGRFIGMPEVESLNARMRLVITNGRFDFSAGAPAVADAAQ